MAMAPRPAGARAGAADRARARGGVAEEPARHRGLGVRAHRALDRHRHAQPRGGAAAGAEEPADPGAGDLSRRRARRSGCCRPRSPRSRALVDEQRAARAVPDAERQAGGAALRARGRAGADRRAAEVHRRGEGGARGDARRARGLDRGDAGERDGDRRHGARPRLAAGAVRRGAAEPRPGRARRADGGDVEGRALQPDRAADAARAAGEAAARADRRRRPRRRRRERHRPHRADGDAEPLDPPAGRHLDRARHPALRHRPLHPDRLGDALEARRGGRGAGRGARGDPAGAAARAHLLHAARPPVRQPGARRSGSAARRPCRRPETGEGGTPHGTHPGRHPEGQGAPRRRGRGRLPPPLGAGACARAAPRRRRSGPPGPSSPPSSPTRG